MIPWNSKLASVIIAVLLSVLVSTQGYAQETTPDSTPSPGGANLFGARFSTGVDGAPEHIELQPGQTGEITLILSNQGSDAVDLRTFTSNTITAVNGGLTLEPEDSEPRAPLTWMAFTPETVHLDPGQESSQTISIAVPDDAQPGEYANAIAVETVEDYAVEGSINLRQRLRKVLPVFITVPGDMNASFTLGEPEVSVEGRYPQIIIPIENTGNVRIRPEGDLIVTDSSGVELLHAPIVIGYVYAGDATMISMRIRNALPPGDYHISLEMKDSKHGLAESIKDATLVMPELATSELAPVEFSAVEIEPDGPEFRYANVRIDVVNRQSRIASSTLTMSVYKDGTFVEDFVLANSLVLPQGTTTVEQRYIPVDDFETGTYSFSLTLDSVDPNSGAITQVLSVDDVATLEVP